MKLLARTLLILVAALLIAGALLAFGQSAFADQLRANAPRGSEHSEGFAGHDESEGFVGRPGRGERGERGQLPADAASAEGFTERTTGHGEHYEPSLLGLAKLGGSLLKIAVIVALFAVGTALLGRRPRATT